MEEYFYEQRSIIRNTVWNKRFLPKDAKVKREIESKLAKILVFGVMMKLLHQQLNM